MVKIYGVPLPRGNLKFCEELIEGRPAFFTEDRSARIDPVTSGPEGTRDIRFRYEGADTIISLIEQWERRNAGENFFYLYWYVNTMNGIAFSIKDFRKQAYADVDQERKAVRIISDFLWSSDGSRLKGNFETKSVTIHQGVHDRLFRGSEE
jgi:hypothetical protein